MATTTIDIRARDRTQGTLRSIERSLGRLAGIAASAFGVSAISRQVNAYQGLQNRLKLVTGSAAELARVQEQLFGVANRTNQGIGETSELYQKLALNADQLGLSQAELIRLTESVNQSIALSGAAGPQAAAGILQLSQAFASGRLQGDEFRSISENIPDILSRIAEATGRSRGELKQLASEGKLTGQVLAQSLLATADRTSDSFGRLERTLAQSIQVATNNFTMFIGKLDEATGASSKIGSLIVSLSENLDSAAIAAGSFIAAYSIGKLVAMTRAIQGVTLAQKALNVVMRLNPILLVASAFAAAAVAAYNFLKPLFEVEATLGEKILYSLEKFIAGVRGVFAAAGSIVSEFASMVYEALTLAFSLENPLKAFENFGSRLATAASNGFNQDFKPVFMDDARYRQIDGEVQRVRNSLNGVTTETDVIDSNINSSNNGMVELGESADALNKRLEQTGQFFRSITGSGSALESAVENFERVQRATQGINEDEYQASLNRRLASDADYQEQALAAAAGRISREIDLLRAANSDKVRVQLEYQDRIKQIEEIFTIAANNDRITLTEDGIQTLNQIKENLQRESLAKQYQAEIDHVNKINDAYELLARKRIDIELNTSRYLAQYNQRDAMQRIGYQEQLQGMISDRIEFEKKSELEKTQFGLEKANEFFTGMTAYNKKFARIQKAIAISQAIVNTYQGATKALATYPPPFNFIAAAATVASGLAQVAAIRAQPYQRGGDMITGQPALVGEDGPELIVPKQPSTVIPREVADAIGNMGGGKGEPVVVNFNITTVDAEGFDELLISRRGTITGIINQAMQQRGRQGVV